MINPYAKEWEAEKIFPAHKVFKKFGEAGLLGIHRFRQPRDSCKLRILLKQDTALLSHVSQSVSVSVTGVTSQVFSII